MSIIKGHLVGVGRVDGEYLIDPAKVVHTAHHLRPSADSPEQTARMIIDEAQQQAEAIVSAAQAEADGIRAAASQEGYDAGYRELEAQRAALAEQAAGIEAEYERRIEEYWDAMEPEVLRLAVEIAGKIIRKEIEGSDDFVLTTIKAGLQQLRDKQDLKIRVNPADYEFVREHKEDISASYDGVRGIEVIQDRRVDRGGAVIESSNGHLDARLDTQLKEVERTLLEAAHDGRNEVAADTE